MGQRLIAAAVVVASACTALQLSTTSQETVVVSNNPYPYPGPGMQSFTVSAATSGDDDSLQSISFNNCNSQWTLMLNPNETLPTRICNGLGSGGSATADMSDGVFLCPHTYTFSVGYSGTQSGLSSCNVDITTVPTAGGSASTIQLMLSGSGSGSGISVSPLTIDFQDVQINTTSSSLPVTVTNNGTSGATVNMTISGTGFAMNPPAGSYGLGSGLSMSFNVTCQPTATTFYSGSVQASSGTSIGMTSLSCTGINSNVTIDPTPVTFDPTLVGQPPPDQSVTISGGGSGATLNAVTLDATATGNGVSLVTNPVGMQIGGGLTIVLHYAAAAEHQAGPLGTLTIQVSGDSTPSHNIGISGTALLAGVGTNPASVEFGAVCVGSKAQKDVEVYASEAADINLVSLTPPMTPFAAMPNVTLPHGLMGNHNGASITVKTSMMPAAAGEFTDKLVLNTDIPNMAMTNIAMHGIALAAGIAATPNTVHFGSVMSGTTTSVETVQLTNCGTSDLMFTGAHITGANATEFTLIGANPARTLKPTESEIFMIVMQPQTVGAKVAQLVIEHSAGTTTADLDGTATGGSNKDRETYYACSTGRGAAAWPVALALLALRRRRRHAR